MSKPKYTRCECFVLGKQIGTMVSWDLVDGDDEVFSGVFFENVRLNLLGKTAFMNFTDGHDILFDIFFGAPVSFDPKLSAEEDNGKELIVDWSVFND